MGEFDYYSIMQKRIEYFAKKYDPHDSLTVKEKLIFEKIIAQKQKKIRQKISAGYAYIISVLF